MRIEKRILKALSKDTTITIIIFLSFIITRIFFDNIFFISSDSAKYLELATNFPTHTLYNHDIYLIHPFFHSYTIFFFSLFTSLPIAGVLVSFLSSVSMFLLLAYLFSYLKIDKTTMNISLLIISFSDLSISLSKSIFKESLFVLLFFLSIVFFIKWVDDYDKRYFILSSLFGSLAAVTSNLFVFLIPVLLIYSFSTRRSRFLRSILPIIPIMIVYLLLVIYPRYSIYTTNEYFPAGLEGTIEKVDQFGAKELINPFYFRETSVLMEYSNDLDAFRIFRFIVEIVRPDGLIYFSKISGIPESLFFITISLLFLAPIVFVLKNYRKIKQSDILFILILIFTLYPALQSKYFFWARHSYAVIVPLSFYMAVSIVFLMRRFGLFNYRNYIILFVSAGFLVLFLTSNNVPFTNPEYEIEMKNTSEYINTLPEDGFMIQVGYVPEIIYQTNKRAIGLPHTPDNLELFINLYDIKYIIYGSNHPEYAKDTIEYIMNRPNDFRLINKISEHYESIDVTDATYIYEVA